MILAFFSVFLFKKFKLPTYKSLYYKRNRRRKAETEEKIQSGRNGNFRKRLTLFQNELPYHPLQVVGGAFCSPIKTSAETHSVVLGTSPTTIFPLLIFLIISLEAGETCCKMIYSINLNASGPSL